MGKFQCSKQPKNIKCLKLDTQDVLCFEFGSFDIKQAEEWRFGEKGFNIFTLFAFIGAVNGFTPVDNEICEGCVFVLLTKCYVFGISIIIIAVIYFR